MMLSGTRSRKFLNLDSAFLALLYFFFEFVGCTEAIGDGQYLDEVKDRYPAYDACNGPHEGVDAVYRKPKGHRIEEVGSAAGEDECCEQKVKADELGIVPA